MALQIALKIDVDTYRGIEDGAVRLAVFLHSKKIPASFFVSLGPDNSGWAATRIFHHKGFLKKMNRTNAVALYGLRTVLSGTLLPARPMGTSFKENFRQWRDWGFEVSPHGFDHILWHDQAAGWSEERAARELGKITEVYGFIFAENPTSFAAPGWQAGGGTWRAMEKMNLLYHSDTRGAHPYFPSIKSSSPAASGHRHLSSIGSDDHQQNDWHSANRADGRGPMGSPPETGGNDDKHQLKTLEIPTTLPTWDEMLTWDGIDRQNLVDETWKLLKKDSLNVWTLHSEFEGTAYFSEFSELIERAARENVFWAFLPDVAKKLLENASMIPAEAVEQGSRPGRAGAVTCQVNHG